jgi:hypothetical protein
MIAGDCDNATGLHCARIAEADMEILRIRKVRTDLIRKALRQSEGSADPAIVPEIDVWKQLFRIDRYDRRALSLRKRALRNL